MFSKFNSIVSTNGNSLSFPGSSRMFINGNGIQTDVGQITTTTSTTSFQKASTIMSSNGIQIFPALNAVQNGLNVQGSILGVYPGAPTITSVANNIPNHAGEIQVNFNAPSNNGGSAITSYKVYAYNGGTIVNANGISGSSSPIYYTGLTSGTSYTFKVSAVNGTGEGPLSDASIPIVVVQTVIPVLSSVTTGNVANRLTITLSSTPSAFISDYQYTTNANDGTPIWRSAGTITSPFNITFQSNGTVLASNTIYNISVREVASSFHSDPSNRIQGRTIPDAPTGVSVTTPASQQQLNVTYNPVSGTSSGLIYEYTTNNGSNWLPLGSSTISYQSTGSALLSNTLYTIQIRANNTGSNTGGVSALSLSSSSPTLASAPTNLSTSSSTPGQIQVSFTPPSGSATILRYEYSFDGSAWYSSGSSTSPITIYVLTNALISPIYVRAFNSGGEGASSIAVSGISLAFPPTGLFVSALSTTQLQVSFTPASGTETTGYDYSLNGISWTPSGSTTSPITIGSLTPNTLYGTIYLRTVNSSGNSAASLSASGTTLATNPTINTITSTASQTLSIEFNAPTGGGAASITNYKYSTDNGSTFVAMSPTQTSSPLVITTQSVSGRPVLVNGTSYNILIRAVNAGGDGTVSNTVAGTPVAPGPTVVTNMDPLLSTSYSNQINPVQSGYIWKNSLASAPSSSLSSGTASWGVYNAYAAFQMINNYWQCANTSDFSLNGTSKTITIWTTAVYNSAIATPVLFYKFNGESGGPPSPNPAVRNSGYFIGGTPAGTGSPFQFTFGIRNADSGTYSSATVSTSYSQSQWYMLTFVASNVGTNNASFTLYVNGGTGGTGSSGNGDQASITNINTSSYDDTTNNNVVSIGSYISNKTGANYLSNWQNGLISTIKEYNSALSASDVLSIFNASKSTYGL